MITGGQPILLHTFANHSIGPYCLCLLCLRIQVRL